MDWETTEIKKGNLILARNMVEMLRMLKTRFLTDYPDAATKKNIPTFDTSGIPIIPEEDMLDVNVAGLSLDNNISTGDMIKIQDVYAAFMQIFVILLNLRKVISKSFYNTNGTYGLEETKECYAFLIDFVTSRTSTEDPQTQYYVNGNNIKGSTEHITKVVSSGDTIIAENDEKSAVEMISEMYKSFNSTVERNSITYNLYRCHYNCHSNCWCYCNCDSCWWW